MNPYDYPLSDGSSIVKVRKARKQYRCQASDRAHDKTIQKGELYARIKLTPGMGHGWRELTLHIDCVDPA